MQPLPSELQLSGGGRGINLQSVSEVIALMRDLERQGARIEWSGGRPKKRSNNHGESTEGGFPAKVYPPDPTKPMLVFHGSTSDRNAATIYRGQIRRAGLTWPGEKHSRKETPMSTPAPSNLRRHGTHLTVPPGVRNRTAPPTKSAIDAFLPYAQSMQGAFWTDELTAKLKAAGVSGFNARTGGASVQRTQALLDWCGYRVIQTRPNRAAFSYRWALEAEAKPGVEGRVTPIRPEAAEEAESAPKGFEVFPKPERTKRHDRKECVDCGRHFTPDGLEHHYETSGHGPQPESPYRDPLEGTTADVALKPDDEPDEPLPEPEPAAEPLQPETTTMAADYAAMEELAQETEAKLTAATAELEQRDADIERLNRELRAAREMANSEAEKRAIFEGQEQQNILVAREEERAAQQEALAQAEGKLQTAVEARKTIMGELDLAREERNRALEKGERWEMEAIEAGELLAEARAAGEARDGSWRLDLEDLGGLTTLADLMLSARAMGVVFEIRARRA